MPEVKSTMGLSGIEVMDGYTLTEALTPRELSELLGMDYEVIQLMYTVYAGEYDQYGAILGGLEEYEIPMFDMFIFPKDQLESMNISFDGAGAGDLSMDDMFSMLEMAQSQMQTEKYSRMVVYLNLPEESEETFAFLTTIREIIGQYYEGDYYVVGNSASSRDLSASFLEGAGADIFNEMGDIYGHITNVEDAVKALIPNTENPQLPNWDEIQNAWNNIGSNLVGMSDVMDDIGDTAYSALGKVSTNLNAINSQLNAIRTTHGNVSQTTEPANQTQIRIQLPEDADTENIRILIRSADDSWRTEENQIHGRYAAAALLSGDDAIAVVQEHSMSWLAYGLTFAGLSVLAGILLARKRKTRQ